MQRLLLSYRKRLVPTHAQSSCFISLLLQSNARRSKLGSICRHLSTSTSSSSNSAQGEGNFDNDGASLSPDSVDNRKADSMAIFNRLKNALLAGNFQSRNLLRIAADDHTFAVSNYASGRQAASSSSASEGYDDASVGLEATPPSPDEVLMQRQLKLEEDVCLEAIRSYAEVLDNLFTMGKGAYMTRVQRMILSWYEPFIRRLDAELKCK